MKSNYNHQLNVLIKFRAKIILPLLFLTIAPYFFFIGVIAFKPEMFSPFIFDTHISLGIFLGLVLILLIFIISNMKKWGHFIDNGLLVVDPSFGPNCKMRYCMTTKRN